MKKKLEKKQSIRNGKINFLGTSGLKWILENYSFFLCVEKGGEKKRAKINSSRIFIGFLS